MKKLVLTITVFFMAAAAAAGFFFWKKLNKPEPRPEPIAMAEDAQITLIEGWTLRDIAQYLERQNIISANNFLTEAQLFDTANYTSTHVRKKGASLEGYIFPDTYRIPKLENSTATSSKIITEAILKRALQNFENKFTDDMIRQAENLNMSIHEIVTLASIIEKETGRNVTSSKQRDQLENERNIISGIFHNRLKAGMALQSDATINYITGKNDPGASYADLEIDSPYNTYKYRGLPPGPIANPSLSSLKAALNPTQTEYFYFLHKQPSGQVFYAKTFEEHIRNRSR